MFAISTFSGETDTVPKPREVSTNQLANALMKHSERPGKDGPLWSPASYGLEAARANDQVQAICCLVLDFDGGERPEDFEQAWKGLECVLHSTFSHTPEHPKWRAVFPFAAPIPGGEWEQVYPRLALPLGRGCTDASCGDASRMYYLPSCPVGAEHFAIHHEGKLLRHDDFPELEFDEEPRSTRSNQGKSVVDRYNAEVSLAEILEPQGWIFHSKRGGQERWTRPGKERRDGLSGCSVTSLGGTRGFYNFSANADPLLANTYYTLFGLDAALNHHGDHKAAAKALAGRARGKEEPTRSQPPLRSVNGEGATAELGPALDLVLNFLKTYVGFPTQYEPIACALWVAHTYFMEWAECSPYLAILSAEKQSGKTKLLDVLAVLVHRPWRQIAPTEAVLFRTIERDSPTLLLDELDAVFGPNTAKNHEGLRALLNTGNRRGAKVSRCVQKAKSFDLVDFEVFCPKALAGIGRLPDTVADRSIPIRLCRLKGTERVEKFRQVRGETAARPIREALEELRDALILPVEADNLPDALDGRSQDGWEPLVVLADAAGGGWAAVARAAALALSARKDAEEESLGIRLLFDCRRLFSTSAGDAPAQPIATAMLLEKLKEFEEAPWSGLDQKGLTPYRLSKLLKPYGIKPKDRRLSGSTVKSYDPADFADAFERYLDSDRGEGCKSATPQQADVSEANPKGNECCGVADSGGETEGIRLDDAVGAPASTIAANGEEEIF